MSKICMFAANYYPHIGGIENYTYHLALELISLGNSVTVVTSNLYNGAAHETAEGIEIFRMPCYSLIGDRYPVCKTNKEFKAIDRELAARKFDLIIIHARFYFHSVYAAKFAKKHCISCFTIEHGTTHLSVNNKLLDFLGGIWEHGLTGVLKKYCKHYYGASLAACKWSGHFGIKSEGALYPSVDIEAINKVLEKNAVSYRSEYNIPENSNVITFVGRIIPEKGIMQLVKAFNELNLDNAYLFIAGNGSFYDKVKEQANNKTVMLGQIDFEHVISLLGETDIFCLPSDSEGMSLSVLEAVAARAFVITTKTGGAAELITDEKYGIVMKSNTISEIKTALNSAMDEDYRKVCVQNSYNRLIENFTWKETAEKVMKIIERSGKGGTL